MKVEHIVQIIHHFHIRAPSLSKERLCFHFFLTEMSRHGQFFMRRDRAGYYRKQASLGGLLRSSRAIIALRFSISPRLSERTLSLSLSVSFRALPVEMKWIRHAGITVQTAEMAMGPMRVCKKTAVLLSCYFKIWWYMGSFIYVQWLFGLVASWY